MLISAFAPSTDWPGGAAPVDPEEGNIRVSEKRRLDRSLLLRLSDDLADCVDAAATAANMSSAGWVRTLLADRLLTGAIIDRKPSPRRAARPELTAAEAEIKSVVRRLGMVGGAAVQLAKALREGRSAEHAAAETVLADLRTVAADTRKLVRRIL